METTLRTAGKALIEAGEVRLWVLESPDGVIGTTLFTSAGSESCNLMTAFDPTWASFAPGIVTTIAGIEDAAARGAARVDLGYGGFPHKLELASGVRRLSWQRLYPRGPRYLRSRLAWAPCETQERVRRMRVRLRVGQRLKKLRRR